MRSLLCPDDPALTSPESRLRAGLKDAIPLGLIIDFKPREMLDRVSHRESGPGRDTQEDPLSQSVRTGRFGFRTPLRPDRRPKPGSVEDVLRLSDRCSPVPR